MKKFFLTIFFFTAIFSFSQGRKEIDSMLRIIKNAKADTNQALTILNLSSDYSRFDPDSSRLFAKKAFQLSSQINFKKGIAMSYNAIGMNFHIASDYDSALKYYEISFGKMKELGNKSDMVNPKNNIGIIYFSRGEYERALQTFNECLAVVTELKDSASMGTSYNYIASAYVYLANYEKALQNYIKAQKIFEQRNNVRGLEELYNNIGTVYSATGNEKKAIEFYLLSVDACKKMEDKYSMISAYNNLGASYRKLKEPDKALDYFLKSLSLSNEIKSNEGIAANLITIGSLYQDKKEFPKALSNFNEALKMNEAIKDQRGIANSLLKLGTLQIEMNDFPNSKINLEKALKISEEIKTADLLMEVYKGLAELSKKKKDFKSSYEYLTQYSGLKDSVLNEENGKSMAEMQARFDTEKKQREIESLTKDKKIQDLNISKQEANIKKQRIVLFISVGGVLLVMALVFFILKGFLDKKKANKLLEEKNNSILLQKKILEEKNVLVTDSIEYAKGIQETILPSEAEIKKIIPECFILYKPKDIVAGDFYWMKTVSENSQSAPVFFAIADCTGHGVPGAFMSMHSHYLMERIMKQNNFKHPSLLLDELNKQMVETLHQTSKDASAKYGIDMSLIKMDGGKIEFSGARNPLIICSENGLEEIKADRIYIGGAKEKFTNSIVLPEKGSMLYMFTDGYADQKGGTEGKKFFATTLRNLLKEISTLSVEEQKIKLEKTFEEWRGDIEQIDDVLVMGIKI